MNYINDLLAELTSRLPELEWKLSSLSPFISRASVPRGLFRTGIELTGAACIAEIKGDIQTLTLQKNERSSHYLADRINQKINVLVALCQIDSRKKKPEVTVQWGMQKLSTRQQWIQTLEQDLATLETQQQAMIKALEQMQLNSNPAGILSLQGDLGEVERRLTLAREALNQAIS